MGKFRFLRKIFTSIRFQEKKNFLAQLAIFKDLSNRETTRLMKVLKEKTYLKDEILFRQGDASRALFIIFKGKVDLQKMSADGSLKTIGHVGTGEFFGEMALLEDMPRNLTAIATEKTHVFMLFKHTLDNLVLEKSKIGIFVLHYLAKALSARVRTMAEEKK